MFNEHNYSKAVIKKIPEFEKKTGIKVKYSSTPESNYFDKLNTSLSSHSGDTDVYMTGAYQVWEYAPAGYMEPLDDYINNPALTDKDYNYDDFIPGVVGPVRTGKSTFIKKFMDTMVIPKINNTYKKERAKDELPQSGSGKTIHTTEPKFVPNEAIEITIDDDVNFKVRLIDCVGYIVKGALGYLEDDEPKMVNTPWYEYEIPFEDAAEIGTRKVITDHSTIGLVITTDGTISDIDRED